MDLGINRNKQINATGNRPVKRFAFAFIFLSLPLYSPCTTNSASAYPTAESKKQTRLGHFLLMENKFRQAIPYYSRAIKINPSDSQAWNERATARRQCDDAQGALEDVNHAIAIDPQVASFFIEKSQIYSDLQKPTLAIENVNKAIALSGKKIPYYMFEERARLYEVIHENDKALVDFSEALRVGPKEAGCHYDRALLYFKKGRYQEAVNDLTLAAARKDSADHNRIYQLRAKCYEKLGKPDLAAKDMKQGNIGSLEEWGLTP